MLTYVLYESVYIVLCCIIINEKKDNAGHRKFVKGKKSENKL